MYPLLLEGDWNDYKEGGGYQCVGMHCYLYFK